MTVTAAVQRVAELQSMLGLAPATGTGGAAAPDAFANRLSAATSAPAAAAAPISLASATAASPTSLASATAASPLPAVASSLPAGVPFADEITAAAQRHGVDPTLLAGLIKQESGFDPSARSAAGAQGLTQLMPGTAAGLGVSNPLDPAQSIEGGAAYLADQLRRFGGDTARALAAYNAGPGAVERFGGVPPYAETQNYVRSVQAFAAQFRSGAIPA
jgi:soluble lytic murein transglycosylase-like protein